MYLLHLNFYLHQHIYCISVSCYSNRLIKIIYITIPLFVGVFSQNPFKFFKLFIGQNIENINLFLWGEFYALSIHSLFVCPKLVIRQFPRAGKCDRFGYYPALFKSQFGEPLNDLAYYFGKCHSVKLAVIQI